MINPQTHDIKGGFQGGNGKRSQENPKFGKLTIFRMGSTNIENFTIQPMESKEQGEKCEVCGAADVEFKVYFKGQWLKRCRQCTERIKRFAGLMVEEKPSGILSCQHCGTFFVSEADSKQHIQTFHMGTTTHAR